MKLAIVLGILAVLLNCSCNSTKPLKQVRWRDYTFQLTVLDGGALTSDTWEVTACRTSLFKIREDLVFEAYGGPDLTDIQLKDDFLILLADDHTGRPKQIALDLQHLDTLLQDPIRYQRYSLMQSNPAYVEPDFIRTDRELERITR